MSSTLHGPEFMIDSPARCQHNDFFHILLTHNLPQDTGKYKDRDHGLPAREPQLLK